MHETPRPAEQCPKQRSWLDWSAIVIGRARLAGR